MTSFLSPGENNLPQVPGFFSPFTLQYPTIYFFSHSVQRPFIVLTIVIWTASYFLVRNSLEFMDFIASVSPFAVISLLYLSFNIIKYTLNFCHWLHCAWHKSLFSLFWKTSRALLMNWLHVVWGMRLRNTFASSPSRRRCYWWWAPKLHFNNQSSSQSGEQSSSPCQEHTVDSIVLNRRWIKIILHWQKWSLSKKKRNTVSSNK